MLASAVPIASDGVLSRVNENPIRLHMSSTFSNPISRKRLKVGIFIDWASAPDSEYFPPNEWSKFSGLQSSNPESVIESLSRYWQGSNPSSRAAV